MANDKTERLLLEIAQLLGEDEDYPLEGTLLYARLDSNMVAPSVFKDLGNEIIYRRPDLDRLGDALLDLWEAQGTEDRWSEIEYIIQHGRFRVTYAYPDDIDPDEDNFDRRDRIVAHYFGTKPVIYPPLKRGDAPTYEL